MIKRANQLKYFAIIFLLVACNSRENSGVFSTSEFNPKIAVDAQTVASPPPGFMLPSAEESALCPLPDFTPIKESYDEDEPGKRPIDLDQEIKDFGTDLIIQEFFTTKQTLFNFNKFVYESLDNAISRYRNNLSLDDRAIFLLFKGGNVLRIIADRFFNLVPEDVRKLLSDEYAQYTKRSDADFSVYIDETKLNDIDYDRAFGEINDILLDELGKIRKEFVQNPQKYFNFFQLNSDTASEILEKYLAMLPDRNSVKDPNNANWYNAKFRQLRILDKAAKPDNCAYHGQYDQRTVAENGKKTRFRLGRFTSWIRNTDNRVIESSWGSDAAKIVKFYLLRSKAVFELTYEKDGDLKVKPLVAELVDISLPHRKDARLRSFLDNYDKEVAEYSLTSEDDVLLFKSYSLFYSTQDLHFILFDSFERPWDDQKKFKKRLYRIFFLYIVELMDVVGAGSEEMRNYVNTIKTKVIDVLGNLYPLGESKHAIAEELQRNAASLDDDFKDLSLVNHFFTALAELVQRLVDNPKDDDEKEFKLFMDYVKENLDIIEKLGNRSSPAKIDKSDLYNVSIDDLL